MARYLHATESLRWRRPRRAARVRTYSLPHRPRSDLAMLLAVLAGLRLAVA